MFDVCNGSVCIALRFRKHLVTRLVLPRSCFCSERSRRRRQEDLVLNVVLCFASSGFRGQCSDGKKSGMGLRSFCYPLRQSRRCVCGLARSRAWWRCSALEDSTTRYPMYSPRLLCGRSPRQSDRRSGNASAHAVVANCGSLEATLPISRSTGHADSSTGRADCASDPELGRRGCRTLQLSWDPLWDKGISSVFHGTWLLGWTDRCGTKHPWVGGFPKENRSSEARSVHPILGCLDSRTCLPKLVHCRNSQPATGWNPEASRRCKCIAPHMTALEWH